MVNVGCVFIKNLCNGSITTDSDLKHVIKFKSHNHETNPGVLEAERAIYKMKQDAKENFNLPSRIYAKNVTNLKEGRKKIPIENNLKRSLRRIRSNNYPNLKSINELNLDNSKWATTGGKDPQQFLLYDNKNNKNRILVFASQLCLKSLSSSKHIFMDGTFATCPQVILIDFEQAVIKAIEDVLENERNLVKSACKRSLDKQVAGVASSSSLLVRLTFYAQYKG
ncbi:hypothetical protein ACI65C_004645 [Semiaphis heraclei]